MRGTFSESTCKKIYPIPLRRIKMNDFLIWKFTNDAIYTVKSGYYQALGDNHTSNLSSSSFSGDIWGNIWKIKTVHKCLNLIWRACHKILPFMSNLERRGLNVDNICPRCGQSIETFVHALLDCSESKCIWFASSLGARFDIQEDTTFAEWFQSCLLINDSEFLARLCKLWVIWYSRNQ